MMLLEQDAGSSLNPTVANIIIGAVQVKSKKDNEKRRLIIKFWKIKLNVTPIRSWRPCSQRW